MSHPSQAVVRFPANTATQTLSVVVAVIVIGAALLVGIQVRSAVAEVESRQAIWDQAASRFSTAQRDFKAPSPREAAALLAESGRLTTLGVAEGEQLNVMDAVTRLAEAASLANVRVSSVPASDADRHGERRVGDVAIKASAYQLAVEFDGSFARAVQFVSSLPHSVALARMTAARREGPPAYQVFLTVYQVDANSGN